VETLDTGLIVAIAASLIVWGLVSAKFEALNISAPIAFVVVGLVLANKPVSAIDVNARRRPEPARGAGAALLGRGAVNLRAAVHTGVELRLLPSAFRSPSPSARPSAIVLFRISTRGQPR
jgi:hypothetical protein